MTLDDLIARARIVTGDLVAPYLWSDDEWRDYFNEAEEEAAIRAKLIERDQIPLTVTAGNAYVDYPAYVWAARRVFVGNNALQLVDREMIDLSEPASWETQTGEPCACYEVNGQLRLYPIPAVDYVGRMTAYCTPETPMVAGTDEPGIRQRMHLKLLDWALHLAYSKHDADAFDPAAAAKYEAAFEANFGPAVNESALRVKRINVRRAVTGHYF